MRKKVLITGSSGVMGSILSRYIYEDYELTLLDIVEKEENKEFGEFLKLDISKDYNQLNEILKDKDAVIHLAWDRRESFDTGIAIHKNKVMAENIYKSALLAKNHPRLIMASSVHITDSINERYSKSKRLIKPNQISPNSVYGKTKEYIERLGDDYSKKGLKVICLRFGGINYEDKITDEARYSSVWLSHRDYVQLVKRSIEKYNLPNFSVFFGISNNKDKIHDISNIKEILRYIPADDSSIK